MNKPKPSLLRLALNLEKELPTLLQSLSSDTEEWQTQRFDEELEELLEKEAWTNIEAVRLSALFLALSVTLSDESESDDDDDDDDAIHEDDEESDTL